MAAEQDARTPRAGNRCAVRPRSTTHVVAFLALAAHLLLPGLHRQAESGGGVSPSPARLHSVAAPALDEGDTGRDSPGHHDPNGCFVCQALRHAAGALTAPPTPIRHLDSRTLIPDTSPSIPAADPPRRSTRAPPSAA